MSGWLSKRRLVRTVLLVVLAAAVLAAALHRSWVDAQVRAVAVLATTLEVPAVAWAVEAATGEPRVAELTVAGVPTTLVRPANGAPWPSIVFVNGATALGRRHPDVQRLARGLARAGYVVLVPDLPGLARAEITLATARAALEVSCAAAQRADVRGGGVGLLGVSVGTSLALLTAESPRLGPHVSVVAGIAPYADLKRTIRLATTGRYGRVRYPAEPFLSLAAGRSLVAALPPGPDRTALLAELRAVDDDDPDPLALLRRPRPRLGAAARAVVAVLANRDPRRFDALYAALPQSVRVSVAALSPLRRASALRAPVELASAPQDKYFPLEESKALSRAAPHVRVTVTTTLDHAVPRLSLGDLVGLVRFDAFVVRALYAARREPDAAAPRRC